MQFLTPFSLSINKVEILLFIFYSHLHGQYSQ